MWIQKQTNKPHLFDPILAVRFGKWCVQPVQYFACPCLFLLQKLWNATGLDNKDGGITWAKSHRILYKGEPWTQKTFFPPSGLCNIFSICMVYWGRNQKTSPNRTFETLPLHTEKNFSTLSKLPPPVSEKGGSLNPCESGGFEAAAFQVGNTASRSGDSLPPRNAEATQSASSRCFAFELHPAVSLAVRGRGLHLCGACAETSSD